MKKTRTGFSIATLTAATWLLLQFVPAAWAQAYDQDPPIRAGRLGFVEGSVSFQPGGEGDWIQAVANRPLTMRDILWVDRDSRAEVQIGSTSIRLGPETSLTFLDLGDHVTQLRLSMGSLFFHVRRYGGEDAFEIDTPNLAFNVNRAGEFRLDVDENGDQTVATVWRGEAEITGAGSSYRLLEGQQGTFAGVDQLTYSVGEIGPYDSFGRWAMSRDEREDRVRSSRYVSTEMTGYEDLDDYGRWHAVAGYGNVWTPVGVPGDWAPYRYGHWVYVAPWGWTWVEEEPWGFAPFHYGRWAFVDDSWCWVPGPVEVVPVYSPALVAFIGGEGFNLAIGAGGGGVGWFPLAPGEVFVPWYRTSPTYVQNVNVTNTRVNVTQITNVTVNHVTNVTYINQRVTNSVTVVNRDTFVNARPVERNVVRVEGRQIAAAPVTHEVVRSIQPARQSMVGAAGPAQVRPPQQAIARPVVATRQPVAWNRPPAAPGIARTETPSPVRVVRAAPPTQAPPLQLGERGTGRSPPSNAAPPRPRQPETPSRAPENIRPGAENNREVPRPGAPAPAPRPAAPETNREAAPHTGVPENRLGQPENTRPEEMPRTKREQPNRPPETREQPPVRENHPEPRPDNRSEPAPRPEARPVQPPAQREARPEEQGNEKKNAPANEEKKKGKPE